MSALIVIEGIDSSGKETQGKLLVDYLLKIGHKAVFLSFPMYKTPTGKIFRDCVLDKKNTSFFKEGYSNIDPEVVCLYTAADRKYNSHQIEKYLNDDYIVVINRYTSSNMANQASKYETSDERFYMYQWIDKLEYWLLKLPKPDCTILLKMPHKYKSQVTFPLFDQNVNETKVFNAYLELQELYNWDSIDCVKNDKQKSISEIHEEIIELLKTKKFIA